MPEDVYYDGLLEFQEMLAGTRRHVFRKYKHIRSDGSLAWMHATMTPLEDNEGRRTQSLMMAEDITDTNLATGRLEKSEEKFKTLFEESPIGKWEEDFSEVVKYLEELELIGKSEDYISNFFDVNPEKALICFSKVKLLNFNKAIMELFNVKTKQDIFNNFQKLAAPDKNFNALKKIIIAICSGETSSEFESQIHTIDGKMRDTFSKWHILSGGATKYSNVIIATDDITQRNEARNRLETIINTIDGIVWTADPVTRQLDFVSDNIKEITGYEKKEMIELKLFAHDKIKEEDKQRSSDMLMENLEALKPYTIEYRLHLKSGDTKWFKDNISYIKKNYQTESILGITVDITTLKSSQTELENSRANLQRSLDMVVEQNKRLKNFSYIVSHNLRSHSSNIQSLCDLIIQSDSEQEREELIVHLKDIGHILQNTIEGLNEVVSIQDSTDISKEDLNLNKYISHTLNILRDKITQKKYR